MKKVFAQSSSWIEGAALKQVEDASKLPGMSYVAGLPDLHPGKGYPVGASFLSDFIYPSLIGSDIGCGMLVAKINLKFHEIKLGQWHKKMFKLEDVEIASTACSDEFASSLGTVGSGNHFVEIQKITESKDPSFGLSVNDVVIVIHSGSRGLGASILAEYQLKYGFNHLPVNEECIYLEKHDRAVKWAALNREYLLKKAIQLLGFECEVMFDIFHNYVEIVDGKYLHRKGAAATTNENMVIVPGSRGSESYFVKGLKNEALNSIAHGAGRKWKRGDCKSRLEKYSAEHFKKTELGGFVICENKDLLFEEAPQAYKNINQVISDIEFFKLGVVLAKSEPFLNYKTAGKHCC